MTKKRVVVGLSGGGDGGIGFPDVFFQNVPSKVATILRQYFTSSTHLMLGKQMRKQPREAMRDKFHRHRG